MALSPEYQELQDVLKKFTVAELQKYIMGEFPETNWSVIIRRIKKAKRPINSQWVGYLICDALHQIGTSRDTYLIQPRINMMRTYLLALRDREWHTYELTKDGSENKATYPNSASSMGKRIELSLNKSLSKSKKHATETSIEVNKFFYIRILILNETKKVLSVVNIVAKYESDIILLNEKLSKKMRTSFVCAVAEALGYSYYTYLTLSGKNVASLFNIASQGTNKDVNIVKKCELFEMTPEVTKHGTDFYNSKKAVEHAKNVLGNSPKKLNKICIEVETEAKLLESEKMCAKITIKSKDIATTLMDLIDHSVLSPNSAIITSFNQSRSNTIYCKTNKHRK